MFALLWKATIYERIQPSRLRTGIARLGYICYIQTILCPGFVNESDRTAYRFLDATLLPRCLYMLWSHIAVNVVQRARGDGWVIRCQTKPEIQISYKYPFLLCFIASDAHCHSAEGVSETLFRSIGKPVAVSSQTRLKVGKCSLLLQKPD